MNEKELLLILVTGAIYGCFIAGVMLIIDMNLIISRLRANRRLNTRNRGGQISRFDDHLRRLLNTTVSGHVNPGVFKLATLLVFTIVMLAGIRNVEMFAALSLAVVMSGMPYVLMRIKLESMRSKGSFEGETMVSNLLNQYRIRHFNMLEAIEGVIKEVPELKATRKPLFKLLVSLRTAGSHPESKEALNLFTYGINTNWCRMLANNIQYASSKGMDVSLALEDILIQLREARTLSEERKRINSEAVRMTIFMVPLMYLATIILSIAYLDLPVENFIMNQFFTEEGFILIIIIIFLFMINIMLIEIVHNQRFDY